MKIEGDDGILDDAYEPLLNRRLARSAIQEHLAQPVATVRDAVNYGTNLIPRCWHDSEKRTTDVILLLGLTRQAVTLLDGGQELLRQCCCHAAHLQLRGLFEASIYVEWILQDEVRRATAFYVGDLRRMRLACLRALPGTDERRAYVASMEGLGPSAADVSDDMLRRAKEALPRIDEALADDRYAAMNEEFARQAQPAFEAPWYRVVGGKKKSIRGVARDVGRLGAYSAIYTTSSDAMHSSTLRPHVRLGGDRGRVLPLRDPESFGFVMGRMLGEAVNLYRIILERYRPGELANFRRKYAADWRSDHVREFEITLAEPPDSVEF